MKRKVLRIGIALLLCQVFAQVAFAAPQAANHLVTLGWTPDLQPVGVTIASWNIYRSSFIEGPYTDLASEPAGTLTYVDTAVVAGQAYFYVLTSVDAAGTESAYSAPISATIPSASPLSIATTALSGGAAGAAYSFTLSAAGGTPPYTWTGSGVPGLAVATNGLLAGTLTQAGTFVASLMVTDSAGVTAGASLPVIVTAPVPPPLSTFPSGLILYWPLNASDTAGGVAADLSGNSNAGVILGNPLAVPAQVAQALYFGNTGGYITGTQYTGVLSTSLTLAAWINTANTSLYQTILSKFSPYTPEAGYIFTVNDTGNLTVFLGAADILSGPNRAIDATLVADGNWHHVAAVISFEAQTIQFYVDGNPTSSTALNMAANGDGGITLQVGATSFSYWPNYFTGSMDDVQVYGRALSATEVNAIFVLTGAVAQ
jgi:hypothetical protein